MCLYIENNAEFKIAEEDIPCWKVLEYGDVSKDDTLEYGWHSPFIYYPVKSDILIAEGDVNIHELTEVYLDETRDVCKTISEGVIHCYTNPNDAAYITEMFVGWYMFEAIIPKGTEYIEGYDSVRTFHNSKLNNYGAKCIKITDPEFLRCQETKEPPKGCLYKI